MERAKVNTKTNLEEYQGIYVIGEQKFGKIAPITLELVGEARKLSNVKKSIIKVVVLGNKMSEEIQELATYGADEVVYFEHELLENYTTEAYTKVICDYIEESKPEVVLVGATTLGRDLAPRVAGRVGTGLTADCTKLEFDETDGKLLQTRPAFGGNLMATIICPKNRPQMSTVRPGVMEKAQKSDSASLITTITPEINADNITTKIVDVILEKKNRVSLSDAEIIVAGGRGLGSAEGFELIKKLADALGGEVASSRAPVDNGWIEPERQIGQTGTTVKPKIYIACGISGAIQHMTGMQEAECIIAINKNPNAPINQIAHYSINDDLFKVIPELIDQVNNR